MACPILEIEKWRVFTLAEKTWASNSTIVFGEKNGSRIALKINMFGSDVGCYQGLIKEAELYYEVTELLQKHWTPNVVRFVDYSVCNSKNLAKFGLNYSTPMVAVLATELIDGPSLEQQLESKSLSDQQLFSIMFQVIHSIGTLALAGVRHADLHTGNIVLTQGSTTNYKAKINGSQVYWTVPTELMAKIYDWDLGDLASHSNRNPKAAKLKFDAVGVNPKADLYTFLMYIWARQPFSSPVAEFIERCINPALLEAGKRGGLFDQRRGFAHRLCKGPISDSCFADITEEFCSGAWIPPDCLMQTPGEMLQDSAFQPWLSPASDAWGSDLEM